MNVSIRLPSGLWFYNDETPLGPAGGFGEVFAGTDPEGSPVAVKRLKIEANEAAHRELRIAAELAGRDHPHVVPILDAGLDAETDSYFVVMARADGSLQQDLGRRGQFPDAEASTILLQVAQGLAEASDVVHRDLKPGNVLWHDGAWKIADFGIARFVEESTSLRTLRDSLTAPYAAPEQWTGERATGATDVYALGCVGYALLTGRPPFSGPSMEDFQEQHLRRDPPPLEGHPPKLRSLLSMLLRKVPAARPPLNRVIELLGQIVQEPGPVGGAQGMGVLAQAGVHVAERQAAAEAKQQRVQAEEEARAALAREAFGVLREVARRLRYARLRGRLGATAHR